MFRRRHPALDRDAVQDAEVVDAGHVLGFLQAGPLLLPVLAPAAGAVAQVLSPDGAAVGYGAPLVRLAAGRPA